MVAVRNWESYEQRWKNALKLEQYQWEILKKNSWGKAITWTEPNSVPELLNYRIRQTMADCFADESLIRLYTEVIDSHGVASRHTFYSNCLTHITFISDG